VLADIWQTTHKSSVNNTQIKFMSSTTAQHKPHFLRKQSVAGNEARMHTE
jgi:hypothetical protein